MVTHTQALSLAGLSNFFHIFLSMGALLRMQIERAVIAIGGEAKRCVNRRTFIF